MTHLSSSSDFESHHSYYSSQSSSGNSSSSSSSSRSMGTGKSPQKCRAATMPDNSSASTMQKALRADFVGHIYNNVTIRDFVETVWSLESERAQKIVDTEFVLQADSLAKYIDICKTRSSKVTEAHLHKPFRAIARALMKDICDLLDVNYSELNTCLWDKRGEGAIARMTSDHTIWRKPDLLDIFIPRNQDGELIDPDVANKSGFDQTLTWGEPRCAIEFKRTRRSGLASIPEGKKAKEPSSRRNSSGRFPSISHMPMQPTSQLADTGSLPLDSATTSSPVTSYSSLTSPIEPGVSKGSLKRASPLADDDRPSKKTKIEPTHPEGQLGAYALETLIPGTRHYTTGILINGVFVKLWYYDRTAVMRTVEFNFNTPEGASSLGLVLFALSQANMKQTGFDPNLYKFVTPEPGATIKLQDIVELDRPAPTIANSNLCFKFKSPDSKEHVFPVQEVITPYRGIIGRGTFVTAVLSGVIDEMLSMCMRALKLSWQYSARTHEGEIIQNLRAAIPHWKKHLPDPIFYAKLRADDLNLPRSHYRERLRQSESPDDLEISDRDLHILVTTRYEKLWMCKDIGEFKRVFLDCLECHHHAYNTGRVIHRDISENNLMLYRPGEEDSDGDAVAEGKEKEKESRGILNDFDMAALLGPKGSVPLGDPQHHITGTLPFMARELLSTTTRPSDHLYRYDLESFLYLLLWAATHYDLKKGKRRPTPPDSLLEQWNKPGSAVVAKGYLFTGGFHVSLLNYRVEGWEDIWDQWIGPLVFMFKEGQDLADRAVYLKSTDFDYTTCGGMLTFENFMKTIGETPQGLTKGT